MKFVFFSVLKLADSMAWVALFGGCWCFVWLIQRKKETFWCNSSQKGTSFRRKGNKFRRKGNRLAIERKRISASAFFFFLFFDIPKKALLSLLLPHRFTELCRDSDDVWPVRPAPGPEYWALDEGGDRQGWLCHLHWDTFVPSQAPEPPRLRGLRGRRDHWEAVRP